MQIGITSADVEQTLSSGVGSLRFPEPLERLFRADIADDRLRKLIRFNWLGLLVYNAFLIVDPLIIGDVFWLDVSVHCFIVTPIIIAINVWLSYKPEFWMQDCINLTAYVILFSTIVWVVSTSHSPDRDALLSSVSLVVFFSVVVQRLRFFYVAGGCIVLQVIYTYGLSLQPYSFGRWIVVSSVFGGSLILLLFACHRLEHEERRNYLLTLRDRFNRRELELASLRDPLTGVGNRRALSAALQGLALPSDAAPRQVAVLLLDIDHFKLYNDTNGHQEGDACLKQVAAIVVQTVASEGEVFRFGGEEFLILLQPSTLLAALSRAERIRSAIEAATIPSGHSITPVVTVSIGVAMGTFETGQTTDTLVGAADHALYRAKSGGRNQVLHAVEEPMVARGRDDGVAA